jgi:ribonuclease HI
MLKLAERSLPFFTVLRGSGSFHWGPEQQKAFDELKEDIQKLPTLSSPQLDQSLILYVSLSYTIVCGALLQEKEIMKNDTKLPHQVPIYFVSEALASS